MPPLSIAEVNQLSFEDFIQKFGNVVEHCSLCAAAVWRNGPYSNIQNLSSAFNEFMDNLSMTGKEGILRLHPDLAGRLALTGALTQESTNEQASAGLGNMSPDEREKMSQLNLKYKEKFGFPFVICARQNEKEAILKGLEERLNNTVEQETLTGVNEVKKICHLRLLDIVDKNSKL